MVHIILFGVQTDSLIDIHYVNIFLVLDNRLSKAFGYSKENRSIGKIISPYLPYTLTCRHIARSNSTDLDQTAPSASKSQQFDQVLNCLPSYMQYIFKENGNTIITLSIGTDIHEQTV